MFRLAIAALLGAISLSACAQQPAATPASATTAAPAGDSAADKRVRDALKQLDPNFAPDFIGPAPFAGFREVESSSYYGKGYQDVEHRKPSIRNAKRCLNWTPTVKMEQTIDETLDFFLRTVELSEQVS